MAVLEAGLAFALSMLVFATLVSVIVEALHRILRLRQRGFRQMIEVFHDSVVTARLNANDPASPEDANQAREAFIESIVVNRGVRPPDRLSRAFGRRVESLNTAEFMERLAETELGKQVLAEGRERAGKAIDDLALKFERAGDDARAFFRGRARFVSIVVAVCLAFIGNIHAAKLFNGFMQDPELTAKWVEQYEKITTSFTNAKVKLVGPEAIPGDGGPDLKDTIEDTNKALASVSKRMSELADDGLPVGAKFFPVCAQGSPDKDCQKFISPNPNQPGVKAAFWVERIKACKAPMETVYLKELGALSALRLSDAERAIRAKDLEAKLQQDTAPCDAIDEGARRVAAILWDDAHTAIGWFFMVFLSGMLIGLGGPFWFDTAANLMKTRQLLASTGLFKGKDKDADKGKTETAAAGDGTPPPVTAKQPQTPVEAFTRAAEAKHGSAVTPAAVKPWWAA